MKTLEWSVIRGHWVEHSRSGCRMAAPVLTPTLLPCPHGSVSSAVSKVCKGYQIYIHTLQLRKTGCPILVYARQDHYLQFYQYTHCTCPFLTSLYLSGRTKLEVLLNCTGEKELYLGGWLATHQRHTVVRSPFESFVVTASTLVAWVVEAYPSLR